MNHPFACLAQHVYWSVRSGRWSSLVVLFSLGCASAPPATSDASPTGEAPSTVGAVSDSPAHPPVLDPADPAWADLGKSCPSDAPAYSLPAAKQDSIYLIDPRRQDRDDELAEITRLVPGGFGGLYYERGSGREQGPLTVVLVDPTQRTAALETLGRIFAGTGWARAVPELPGAAIRKGRWDFAQLRDWRRYLDRHVFQAGRITTADIDEGSNRLTYGVADEATREQVIHVLQQLDLPCFLVAVEIQPPVRIRG